MFTYLKLKNFKSFRDVTIDLQGKKNEVKNLAIIYGANGSGKSSIAHAFLTLEKTLSTMKLTDMLKELLENRDSVSENLRIKPELVLELIKDKFANNTIEKIISECKMIGSEELMTLEYGFSINGAVGSYLMEFDNSDIVKERLEYKLHKNRGCYFDIEDGKVNINTNIFESLEFLEEMRKQIQMYWGKHSFLSILKYQIEEKSGAYINSNISTNLMNVILEFDNISYRIRNGNSYETISLPVDNPILRNLEGGEVDKTYEDSLDEIEGVINNFFTSLFDDVNKAYYRRLEKNGKINYTLFFNKQIENYKYDIDFQYESSGTQEILELVPYLMMAISGACVIIDEFGIGIHDLLVTRLINAVAKNLKGQLIITTHNTLIMDQADIKPESLYFVINDKTFSKSIRCVTEIEERLHPNYNYRNRYFNNELYAGGLPKGREKIDFTELEKLFT